MVALPFWCFHTVPLSPPSSGAVKYAQPPSSTTISSKARPTDAATRQRTEPRRLRATDPITPSCSVSPGDRLDRHMRHLQLCCRTHKLSSGDRVLRLGTHRNQDRGRRLLQHLVRRSTTFGLSLLDAADVLDTRLVHTGCFGRRRIIWARPICGRAARSWHPCRDR